MKTTLSNEFFYFLNKSKPIKYYRYKSVVRDVFYSIRYPTVGVKDEFIGKNKEDLDIYDWFMNLFDIVRKKNKDMYITTNKIVFEMITENGGIFYLGWYDGGISFGLSRKGDDWIKSVDIKYNKILKDTI